MTFPAFYDVRREGDVADFRVGAKTNFSIMAHLPTTIVLC
jgi:hypothetical protein